MNEQCFFNRLIQCYIFFRGFLYVFAVVEERITDGSTDPQTDKVYYRNLKMNERIHEAGKRFQDTIYEG